MILIIDTVRHPGEHMQLNDAILNAMIKNDENIVFYTSRDYWDSFSKKIKENVKFKQLNKFNSGLMGAIKTFFLLLKIIILSRKFSKIIFLSSITYNTFFISIFNRIRILKPRVFIFLHETSYLGANNNLSTKIASLFLKIALKIGLRKDSKFIVVGEYIKTKLKDKVLFEPNSLKFIEHPVEDFEASNKIFLDNKIIKLASFGVQTDEKNSSMIEKIFKENKQLIGQNLIEISTIGRIDYKYDRGLDIKHFGLKYRDYLIPKNDFQSLILEQDYLLMFIDNKYDLKTSGIIFEAIRFEKPIIALECNLINFYFKKFGDIGFVHKTVEDMSNNIKYLVKPFKEDRYYKQVENLRLAKQQLTYDSFKKEIDSLMS